MKALKTFDFPRNCIYRKVLQNGVENVICFIFNGLYSVRWMWKRFSLVLYLLQNMWECIQKHTHTPGSTYTKLYRKLKVKNYYDAFIIFSVIMLVDWMNESHCFILWYKQYLSIAWAIYIIHNIYIAVHWSTSMRSLSWIGDGTKTTTAKHTTVMKTETTQKMKTIIDEMVMETVHYATE